RDDRGGARRFPAAPARSSFVVREGDDRIPQSGSGDLRLPQWPSTLTAAMITGIAAKSNSRDTVRTMPTVVASAPLTGMRRKTGRAMAMEPAVIGHHTAFR